MFQMESTHASQGGITAAVFEEQLGGHADGAE